MATRTDHANTIVQVDGKQGLNTLGKLELKANDLRKSLKGMKKGSDDYVAAMKKLKGLDKDIAAQRKQLGLNGMTLNQLTRYQRELRNEIKHNATKGTARYKELEQQYRRVTKEVNKQNARLRGAKGIWSGLTKQIKQFGTLALAYLGADALLSQIENLISGSARLSDQITDVQKTTQLTDKEIGQLMKRFKEFNTRTPRKELLALAAEAGKMGKRGVEEISAYVEQTNELTTALGDDLGEDAGLKVAKMAERFNQSMRQIGSGINAVSDSTKANAGFLTNFLSRTAGTAKVAKLSAGELLGFGAAIDEMGMQVEMSSTQVNKFFIDFIKNTEKFEQAAGFTNGQLRKLIGEKGANEGFLTFLERLKETNPEADKFLRKLEEIGIDGERGSQVFLALSGNVDQLRNRQSLANAEIAKGTSLTNEYNKRNENFAATLAKLQKFIASKIINAGLIKSLTNGFEKLSKFIMGTNTATDQYHSQLNRFQTTSKRINPLIDRYDLLNSKTELSNAEQDEMKTLLEQIAKIVPGAVTEFDNYGNAIGISTEKAKEWIDTQQALLSVKNKEAIQEQRSELERLDEVISNLQESLSRRDADGDLFKFVSASGGTGGSSVSKVKLTSDEIAELQLRLQEMQMERTGTMAFLDELTGADIAKSELANNIMKAFGFLGNGDVNGMAGGAASKVIRSVVPDETDISSKFETASQAFDNGHNMILEGLRTRLLEQKMTEEQFHSEVRNLELATLQAKRALRQEFGYSTLDIDKQINDLSFQIEKEAADEKKALAQEEFDYQNEVIDQEVAAFEAAYQRKKEIREKEKKDLLDMEEALDRQMQAAIAAAARQQIAAIEQAQTMEEAGIAIINTVRNVIEAYIAQTVANAVMKSFLTSGNPLLGAILAPLAAAAVKAAFAGLIPRKKTSSRQRTEGQGSGFYYGGDTENGDIGFSDRHGRAAGYVHRNEFVIPAAERNDPLVMNTEALLASRNPQMKSSVNPSNLPSIGMSKEQADEMIEALHAVNANIKQMPKRTKSYVIAGEVQQELERIDAAFGPALVD